VVAGTASATVGAVGRRQQRRAYEEQAAYAPQQQAQPVYAEPVASPGPPPQAEAGPAGGDDDLYAQLQQLGQLHAQGILSDDEFAQAKAKVLG
jgi:hypothetical protein